MNAEVVASIVAALAGIVGIVATVWTSAHNRGRFDERIKNHGERITGVEERAAKMESEINDHAVDIGRLKEWKDGFNAAANIAGHKGVE